jgi:hypothetical protein
MIAKLVFVNETYKAPNLFICADRLVGCVPFLSIYMDIQSNDVGRN